MAWVPLGSGNKIPLTRGLETAEIHYSQFWKLGI